MPETDSPPERDRSRPPSQDRPISTDRRSLQRSYAGGTRRYPPGASGTVCCAQSMMRWTYPMHPSHWILVGECWCVKSVRSSSTLTRPRSGDTMNREWRTTCSYRQWSRATVTRVRRSLGVTPSSEGNKETRRRPEEEFASSGLGRVKVHSEHGMAQRNGTGKFPRQVMKRFPLVPLEEEGQLNDMPLRENRIERIVMKGETQDALIRYCIFGRR